MTLQEYEYALSNMTKEQRLKEYSILSRIIEESKNEKDIQEVKEKIKLLLNMYLNK